MIEDVRAVYETLESLQIQGDYEELNQIAQFAIDAIINDEEELTLNSAIIDYMGLTRKEVC